MDYLSHGFWSYIFFHRRKDAWWAVFFGLLPDNMSWAIYFFYRIVFMQGFGKPMLGEIPHWVFTLYGVSHSLIVSSIVLLFSWYMLSKFPYVMLAWPIAIVMDALTHSREFLPTPFLWPLSDWTFPGLAWSTRWFFITNWVLILSAMSYILIKQRLKIDK